MIRKRNKSHSAQQKDLAEQFTKETRHEVYQGTISKILSDTYDYLDDITEKRDQEEEDSNSSEEEVEEVNTTTALQCLEQLKLWKLQKGNSSDIQALDRIGREIIQYKSSIATQTTLQRFFKPVDQSQIGNLCTFLRTQRF